MTHFLDTLPFDWTDPAAVELRDLLAANFYTERATLAFLGQAGIPPASIAWGDTMMDAWFSIIETARRQDRLRRLLEVIAAGSDTAVAARVNELVGPEPVRPAPVDTADGPAWKGFDDAERPALERTIFDESTLLDVAFLRRGTELAPAVARLLVTMPSGKRYYGTGFRIAEQLLLTNHHVLFDHRNGDAKAKRVEIWFGYERDFGGELLAHDVVMGRPGSIVGAKDHDWAAVEVQGAVPDGVPTIELATADRRPEPDDRVYIIQHPNGGPKQIGMVHNVVRHVDDDVVQYWTDTEGGSSGSPVFDERWDLVALHHRWVEHRQAGRREFRNQGRRIERVVEGLTAAGAI